MENHKNYKSSQVWIQATHIALSGFVFLYSNGVFNTCQANVAASLGWGDNTDSFINLFSTLLVAGITIGCFLTGPMINYFGRRKTLIISDSLFVIFTIILVMPSTVCFGIGRFGVGIAIGLLATIGPIYVGEITPIEMMPKVAPIIYINSGLGMVFAYGFGLMLPYENFESDPYNDLWIFLFLFPALVSLYKIFYFSFFVKYDTPQFYLSRSQSMEAETALRMTHNEVGVAHGLRRVNSEVQGKSINGIRASLTSMLKNKRFTKMLRYSIMFTLIQGFSGITAIYFYSTSIFLKLGGGLQLARVLTLILGIINFLSMLSGLLLLPYFGRKTLIVQSQFSAALFHLLLALFSGYLNVPSIIGAVFLLLFFITFGYGFITTFFLYASEVLNDEMFSFFNFLCFAFAIVISFTFPISVQYIGINNTFLILSGCSFALAVYSCFDFIETMGKDKETILIEMKVMTKEVMPQIGDNDSLQSPNDCEDDDNNKDIEAETQKLKELALNSTGFNDAAQIVE